MRNVLNAVLRTKPSKETLNRCILHMPQQEPWYAVNVVMYSSRVKMRRKKNKNMSRNH